MKSRTQWKPAALRTLLLATFASALLALAPGAPRVASGTAAPRPELVMQTGHAMRVDALAFSPDGRLVASGSADNTVRLWDSGSGRELRRLAGHTNYVRAVAFSPDGARLASGSNDGSVRLWNVATGEQGLTMRGLGGVVSLAFNANGQLLAAGTTENLVRFFDTTTGGEVHKEEWHKGWVTSIAFSPDGRLGASGAKDGGVMIFDAASGRGLTSISWQKGVVKSLAFSPDGRLLASASFDGTVNVWETDKGADPRTLRGFAGKATGVAFAPDGHVLLVAGGDRSVHVFDAQTLNETRVLRGAEDVEAPSEVAAFSPDAKSLATSNGDKTVQLRDLSNDSTRVFESYSSGVYATAFSPDRRWFAAAGKDRTVRVWEIRTGRKVRTLTGHAGWVTSLAFSPDSDLLASASLDGQVKLWDNETGLEVRTLSAHEGSVNSIAFSPDSKTLATAGNDLAVKLWDAATGQLLRTFGGYTAEVGAVAFSPDGKTLATGAADKTVRLWEPSTGRLTRELQNAGAVFCMAYSPDGARLAVGTVEANWTVFDAASGAVLFGVSTTHAGDIRAIAYSPDGKRIATANSDGGATVWDAAGGAEQFRLSGHTDAVNGLAYSPDGAWLATGSEDGSTRIWDAKTGEQAATLVSTTDTRDWLVTTPDGLFDGSPAAWQQIVWRFNQDTRSVAPVEAFFNEFFYPDLLADILAGRRPRAARAIAQIDRRQPVVKISFPGDEGLPFNKPIAARSVKLRIEVTDAPAGARDLRLFRNGSLVYVERGRLAAAQGRATLEAVVPIVAGANVFTAYAFNQDNVKSADARLTLRGDMMLRRAPTTYIVAVGVNEYANARYNLRFAAGDAGSFVEEVKRQRALVEPAGRVVAVTLLNREATKANILTALHRLSGAQAAPLAPLAPKSLEALKPVEPEDVVVVYFAGHGTAQRNRFYLIPHDLGYAGERDKVDAAGLQAVLEHSISDEELGAAFEPLNAGQVVLVLDACNSGQALEAEEKRRGPMNSKGLAQLAYEKGMYVLTAAQSYQAALEAAQLGHGLLTYVLVDEGLRKGEADSRAAHDGQIVVREWFDFAAERVPRMRLEQLMQKRGLKVASSVPTADRAAAEEGVQRPRAFYRRELEAQPLVIAKP